MAGGATLIIKGNDKLISQIRRTSNPNKLFDNDVKRTSINSVRELLKNTNKLTGTTARGWQTPRKLSNSRYSVVNNIRTQDKQKLIARIISDGRGVIRPRKAKKLYIPLTNKGRSKKLGAPIPKNLIFGIDFVLADSARAFRGTKFIDKETKRASIELSKRFSRTIRGT